MIHVWHLRLRRQEAHGHQEDSKEDQQEVV